MSELFSSFKLRSVELKNRLVVSPMCMYSATDGYANDFHLMHLGQFAAGGFALIIAEATAVEPEGRISSHDVGLWSDDLIAPLAKTNDLIHRMGGLAGIQLAHAGRKASGAQPASEADPLRNGWKVVAPSAIAFDEKSPTPAELTVEEIHRIQKSFAAAAKRSITAGYDVIEIHAAHGYLLNEFLSPLANKRTDSYGGSFDNRVRMLIETTREIRKVWPDGKPLFVRISATDWVDGGWNIEESVALAKLLKNEGVDLIDCSSGGMVPNAVIKPEPGYQVPFADAVRKQAGIPTGAVGLIADAKQAEAIIADQQADLILLARGALRDPHFPYHAARALGVDHSKMMAAQYARA